MHDRTALAEAEIEYEMHTSPSVYVRYRLTSPAEAIDARLAGKRVSTIIWTTTPWTLPASLAVAFHPDFEYVALEQDGEVYIVAEALAASTRVACGLEKAHEIARFPGARMERVTFAHPFLQRSILGVLATYVTTDQGTGVVHTAPAHGVDDFATGARYGLSQLCDVDDGGHLRNGLPEYDGLYVFKANRHIIELLGARHALMGQQEIHHSYPHCWRCHRPVIYRATEQWFIKMETPMTERGWFCDHVPQAGFGGDEPGEVGSGLGPRAYRQHGFYASRLVYFAAADLGCTHRGLSVHQLRQAVE